MSEKKVTFKNFWVIIKSIKPERYRSKFEEAYNALIFSKDDLKTIVSKQKFPEGTETKLDGIPKDLQMEALLIAATRREYGDETNRVIDRNVADIQTDVKADVVLMALGLLDGFYHYACKANKKGKQEITACRVKFLKESLYLEYDYTGSYDTYEEAIKNDAEGTIIDALKAAEKRYTQKVAKKLYDENDDIFLDVAVRKEEYFKRFQKQYALILPKMRRPRSVESVLPSSDILPKVLGDIDLDGIDPETRAQVEGLKETYEQMEKTYKLLDEQIHSFEDQAISFVMFVVSKAKSPAGMILLLVTIFSALFSNGFTLTQAAKKGNEQIEVSQPIEGYGSNSSNSIEDRMDDEVRWSEETNDLK